VLGVYRGLQAAVSVKETREIKTDRGRKREWRARSSDRKVWGKRKQKQRGKKKRTVDNRIIES
jgi:hypothetical protein